MFKYQLDLTINPEHILHRFKMVRKIVLSIFMVTLISACGDRIVVQPERAQGHQIKRKMSEITLVEGDINQPYEVVKDYLKVTVKPLFTHLFPTKEQANKKLRKAASRIGADAVIFVKYHTQLSNNINYGAITVSGRAVRVEELKTK